MSIAGKDGLVRSASGSQPTLVCLYMDAESAQLLAAGSAAPGARQFFVSSSSDHQPHINPSESAAGCTSSLLSFTTTTTPAAFFSLSLATRNHVLQENHRCRCPGGRSPNGWLICAIVSSVLRMRCQILARFPRVMAPALPFLTMPSVSALNARQRSPPSSGTRTRRA